MTQPLGLREQIATTLLENWTFDIPVLWENMPTPSPLPHLGWINVNIRFGRSMASGWGQIPTLHRGRLQIQVAVHQGEGMETSDAMVIHLITQFNRRHIGAIHFGQANVQAPIKDDGVVITTITIRFHAPLR